MTTRRTIRSRALFAAAAVAAGCLLTPIPALAAPADTPLAECENPDAASLFASAHPAKLGFDTAKLQDALNFGKSKGAWVARVYRHGCLAGKADYDANAAEKLPTPLASSTKGVLSVAVGRAVAMGLFSVDDPIGKFFPEADAAHGAITIRQVLNQTTGLKHTWAGTIGGVLTDEVQQALHAPFEFAPGTTYEYAQAVLNILVEVIERTSGAKFLDWVQTNVMAPLGVSRDHWVWAVDRSGKANGSGALAMRPDVDARFGQMLLQGGVWKGKRLLTEEYVKQAAQPTSANGGYGFLFWLNAGDSYKTASVPKAKVFEHPMFPGSPRDLYSFVGALGQFITIIPSLDMVIVRTGIPATLDPNNIQLSLAAESNPDNKEFLRRVAASVNDVAPVAYDDPYRYGDSFGPVITEPADLVEWADPMLVGQLLLGVGPESIPGCGMILCNNSNVAADVLNLTTETLTQVFGALIALPR